MAKHDITSVGSPVAVYVSDNEVYLRPCSDGEHLWAQDNPGAPIMCVDCGTVYVEKKPVEQLRKEIWDRVREYLQSGEYGYA